MLRFRLYLLVVLPLLVLSLFGGWNCTDETIGPDVVTDHQIRFYSIGGDSQFCDSMDTLDDRMAVQLDSGDNLPLRYVALSFKRIEGYGQTVGKPTGETGTNEVKVATVMLGRAYVNYQGFTTCQAKVRVTIDTMPELQLEFVINPGVVCQFPPSPPVR